MVNDYCSSEHDAAEKHGLSPFREMGPPYMRSDHWFPQSPMPTNGPSAEEGRDDTHFPSQGQRGDESCGERHLLFVLRHAHVEVLENTHVRAHTHTPQ